MKRELRRGVRLKVDRGVAVLRLSGIPSIVAELIEMSETGCLCRVSLQTQSADVAALWYPLLKRDLQVLLEITRPPEICDLRLLAQIRHVNMVQSSVLQIGFQFAVGAEQQHLLPRMMLSVAAQIVRKKTVVMPANLFQSDAKPAADVKPATDAKPVPNANPAAIAKPAAIANPTAQRTPKTEHPSNATRNPFAQTFSSTPGVSSARPAWPAKPSSSVLEVRPMPSPKPIPAPAPVNELPVLKATHLIMAMTQSADSSMGRVERQLKQLLRGNPSIDAGQLVRALGLESDLPLIDLDIAQVPAAVKGIFSYLTLLRHNFVPFACSDTMLCIAAIEPLNSEILKNLASSAQRHILVFIAPALQIQALQFKDRSNTKKTRRLHTRIKTSLQAHYRVCEIGVERMGSAIHMGQILNISEGGALLAGPSENGLAAESMSARFRIEMCIDPEGRSIKVSGRIVVARTMPLDANFWLYGLEWIGLAGLEARHLSEFYRELAIEQLNTRSKGFELG